jgi:1-hydroxycarotenoid 3,4-desaturase
MHKKHVVVVGAGMGGLTSALRLAHYGYEVTVLDSQSQAGGKVHTRDVASSKVDSGPTVFTMRWVFEELFNEVGADLESELSLTSLEILARHFWPDGSALDLSANAEQSEDNIAAWSSPAEALRFRKFCDVARKTYQTLEGPFIRSARPNMLSIMTRLGPQGLLHLGSLGPMSSLWQQMEAHFKDERLRQLFGRYATYCGSSPWEAPATLMLIAQVEMDGVWSVKGGMTALSGALVRLSQERGARFRFNSTCKRILKRQGRVCGVVLQTGEEIEADAVVFNGDANALRQGLLSDEVRSAVPANAPARSLSALTWSVYAKAQGVTLDRHNVFFHKQYASEFEDIFKHKRLPRNPTVYVCAQDQPGHPDADQPQRLLCLVNAPAVGDQDSLQEEAIVQCQEESFQHLERLGLKLEISTTNCVRTSPQECHQRFPASGGALYGQATHGWTSIFSRPGSRTPLPGLFLAGGSVHPGPGVPMAAMSGRLAAEDLMASHGLTNMFHKTATSGGTSTP